LKKFKDRFSRFEQHRRVTDSQPANQPSFQSKYRAICYASRG